LPMLAHWFFGARIKSRSIRKWVNIILIPGGIILLIFGQIWGGLMLLAFGLVGVVKEFSGEKLEVSNEKLEGGKNDVSTRTLIQQKIKSFVQWILEQAEIIIVVIGVIWLLARYWLPLGPAKSLVMNVTFVALLVILILGFFTILEYFYKPILKWCLDYKVTFLMIPSFLILLGATTWMGFNNIFGFVAKGFDTVGWNVRTTKVWSGLTHTFPAIGKEFMPSLNEGSFLLMPTSMPHSGFEYNRKVLGQLDMLISNIPEVEITVGKLGRVESALDPAPISMYENVINYRPEYMLNDKGHRARFKVDRDNRFILVSGDTLSNEKALERGILREDLIPDKRGNYYRNWRPEIKSPDDIWNEIVRVAKIPGVTSAPKLQPIETRLVMLQTGMRAPMGIKVYGPDLPTIEAFGMQLEEILQEVPSVKAEAVFADRIVGKPYLHLNINREKISRYGLTIEDVQQTIETAIGGMKITSTVEGRERFPVRVRYPRELRDDPESLGKILIPTPTGAQIPISQIVDFEYVRGPQAIKSEETFLVGYVLFDKREGYSEVRVVNDAQNTIQAMIDSGELSVPAGISYKFSGSYENQVRAEKRLSIIVPLVLAIVFLILYFQFKSVTTSLMVFSGIAMAFSGGFMMIWLYGQGWFVDFSIFGTNMRELFQMHTINLSVAVWVGFIALFGIATDDGVLMATYLDQSFARNKTDNLKGIRAAVVEAGQRRIKPAVMTSATTIIALLPILTSTGRGADIMIPMAIPAFGGMIFAAITYFIVPVLYSFREERKLKKIQS
jgi:copper/silver efflux system protein